MSNQITSNYPGNLVIHKTTMSGGQRKELIRILCNNHSVDKLAVMNDRELHMQWLRDCEYIPPIPPTPAERSHEKS